MARALTIRERALGASHPDVAQSLNSLAELYRDQGAYTQAEPLYARALTLRGNAFGSDHPLVASSLNNLALLYGAQGAYAMKARTQEMRAKLVEAEAQIPMSIADAFRSGRLGVMDYYNMRNVMADTDMRQGIAGSVAGKRDGGTEA